MRAVVTGVAGFVGSSLADALIDRGDEVVGIDCFAPYYDRSTKLANLAPLRDGSSSGFELHELDLRNDVLEPVLDGAGVVFHQAAQPGVRASWGAGFDAYVSHNVLGTQRLLEACRVVGTARVVNASSSSVYGDVSDFPTHEDRLPQPYSPYGVTKLAAEHLCNAYAANWRVPTVSLRYFTVYGPRQRPDMAMHRLVQGALRGRPFALYGDGGAVRDFTYVDDVVRANLAAADADLAPGVVINIAGGSSTRLSDLIALIGEIAGSPVPIEQSPAQAGDPARTGGSIERARSLLGWEPRVTLEVGLAAQVEWQREAAAESVVSDRPSRSPSA